MTPEGTEETPPVPDSPGRGEGSAGPDDYEDAAGASAGAATDTEAGTGVGGNTGTRGEVVSKRFVSGLVLDRDLSPRARLGSSHVRQLAESIRAGVKLPPVVIERDTSQVVDGFHRVEAHRRVSGREALIETTEKHYEDEADLFEDAIRLNSAHGSRLSPYDQVRCAAIGKNLSIDPARLARALSVTASYLGDLTARRTGTEMTTRAPIPLKRTIEHMRGRDLTPAQTEANDKLGGQSQTFYITQLNLLAEHRLFDLENERVREGLRRLKENLAGLDFSESAG